MATVAIELNDAGLIAATVDGAIGEPSPGYALVDGESIRTGRDALTSARLHPRRIDNRFWFDLGTTPLHAPFPAGVSRADLGHAHLGELWRALGRNADDVVLAVSGTLSETELGLLVGIAQAAAVPVRSVVDRAVAAIHAAVARGAIGATGGRLHHLDLELHRAVLTEVTTDDAIVRRRVEVSDTVGVAMLDDAIAKHVAIRFLRTTRFDPLHAAATEQALYDALPQWLEALEQSPRAIVTLDAGDQQHEVELRRAELVAALADVFARVVDLARSSSVRAPLLVSHRVAKFPQLTSLLEERTGARLLALPSDSAAVGAAVIATATPARDTVQFLTRSPLPANTRATVAMSPSARPSSEAPPQTRRDGPRPTHVLWNSEAYDLSTAPLTVGTAPSHTSSGDASSAATGRWLRLRGDTQGVSRQHCRLRRDGAEVVVEDLSTYGTWLNGDRVDGIATLYVGDVVRVGSPGVELRLIVVRRD